MILRKKLPIHYILITSYETANKFVQLVYIIPQQNAIQLDKFNETHQKLIA